MAPRLTEREKKEILRLLKSGKPLTIVAGLVGRSINTIKSVRDGEK